MLPDAGRDFSCALSAVLIGRVRRVAGDDALARLLHEASSPRTLEYLTDLGNWISYAEAVALWEAGAELTGDPQFARHVGADFVRQLAGSGNSTVLRALGSPEDLLRKIAQAGHRFSTAADLDALEVRPGYAEIRAVASPGFVRHRLHCEWTAGLLTQATALFGLPPATVAHERCQAAGAPACHYRVTWDTGVAADAGAELAALREQLDAMSARLQSVFDTAADLIATTDLDAALARITERAGLQVRAPRYLLAVRPTPGGDLHCHQSGFAPAEARRVAELALAPDAAERPDHYLIAEVRSTRHHYGALVAAQKPGGRFFDHERELLEVYARYAATALDTATALAEAHARQREAQRRYEESATLLELARRLARAGSSDQVAQRLADAVPGVVDCDRVSVYVWSEELGRLERRALNATPEGGGDAGLHAVHPGDVPQLASWIAQPDPEPLFIDIDGSAVKGALREIGAVAAIAVPIATDERFLGCFVVSAMDRPERLAHSPELVDRLSGVAAQALIALENGRLVDRITHQARHDQLTGVANRAGFHEQLAAATASDATLALFYVDLDQFKPINDAHGHEVGDAVLRAVGRRLAEHLRAGDTVARLGGDEFAVLVADVADSAQLAAISARLAHAFDRPLMIDGRPFAIRASIGRAVWPMDSREPEALLRIADAAMYESKRMARA